MILFLQNIPTPYRMSFFDKLDHCCRERATDFRVLYCGRREHNRHWKFDLADAAHPHEVLKGLHPVYRRATFHINPTVMLRIRQLKPRLLLCGGSWNLPTNWLVKMAAPRNTSIGFWSEGHADSATFHRGMVASLRKSVLNSFSWYVVPNARSADWIRSHGGGDRPFIYMPNTVNEEFYKSNGVDEQQHARQKLGIDVDERVIVQLSQLEPRKGVLELIDAYQRLPSDLRTGTVLAVLGTGTLANSVVQAVGRFSGPGKIIAPGHVQADEVRTWLQAADWFCLNTFSDPNPLSPIEASFASTPLLLSKRAGNFDELMVDGRAGIAIEDPRDPEAALAQAIKMPRPEVQSMGCVARSNADAVFSRAHAAINFLNQLSSYGLL